MSVSSRFSSLLDYYTRRSTSLRLQIVLVLLNSAILGNMIYQAVISEEKIFDPRPSLIPIIPRPQQELTEIPTAILTGLDITSFPVFEITRNKFVIHAIVWFIYNPDLISSDLIEQFSFDKCNITKKSQPNISITSDNKLFAKYNIVAEFNSDLDYRYFPLDNHRIFLKLTNLFIDKHNAVFLADNSAFKITDATYAACLSCYSGSVIKYIKAEYGYTQSQLIDYDPSAIIEHPAVLFSFDFIKPGVRSTLLIIIPILLMFFMSLFPLALDPVEHSREILAFSIGILTSILTYRFVIETLSPQIDYFTMGDYIYTFVLICVFLLFLFNMTAIRTKEVTYKNKLIRMTLILFLHCAIVFFVYNILNTWI